VLQLHQPDVFSHPQAYLFKIAANVATDRMRQRVTRARVDQSTGSPTCRDQNPDRRVLAKEQLDLVERALAELPPNIVRRSW
jgi:DNA-directed RNA polymerase specialized sigma24 family protein